jgi:sigma-54 dependent transcriptional regulator, acetoin dehydrogenase operon transcriptional activator AcoR
MNYSDIISESHKRCVGYGLHANSGFQSEKLSYQALNRRLKRNSKLLEIANPLLVGLENLLKDSGFVIILTDSDGFILDMKGDEQPLKDAEETGIKSGVSMNEKNCGTNSMGTAIATGLPVQISSDEHFLLKLHRWTCSAAPVLNNKDEIVACINLSGVKELSHPHTIAIVASVASAIQGQFALREMLNDLEDTRQYAFAMMNSLSYGVIAIDMDDKVHWVNDTACRLLNFRRNLLLRKQAGDIIPQWVTMKQNVCDGNEQIDIDGTFSIPALNERFHLNLLPILNEKKVIIGFLLTFRSIKRTIEIIQRYGTPLARFNFEDIIAESEITIELISRAHKISGTDSTILITGESGTGKEVYAQSIHNASNRKDKVFLAVNCGALSESLIESELFGYEEGSFTGAMRGGRPGKFELANEGTLFLDEIGDMPLDMQVKLLRTLQEGNITRIGGNKPIKVDVRIIAATNKQLLQQVKEGKFRLDLYYRLNVIQLDIPPLRDRTDDILPLANMFLRLKSAGLNKPLLRIDRKIAGSLIKHKWPGNIRELENFIEKFVVFDGKLDWLTDRFMSKHADAQSKEINFYQDKSLDQWESEIIKSTLDAQRNNITKTASVLKISRNTLYQKIKKYNINTK